MKTIFDVLENSKGIYGYIDNMYLPGGEYRELTHINNLLLKKLKLSLINKEKGAYFHRLKYKNIKYAVCVDTITKTITLCTSSDNLPLSIKLITLFYYLLKKLNEAK